MRTSIIAAAFALLAVLGCEPKTKVVNESEPQTEVDRTAADINKAAQEGRIRAEVKDGNLVISLTGSPVNEACKPAPAAKPATTTINVATGPAPAAAPAPMPMPERKIEQVD